MRYSNARILSVYFNRIEERMDSQTNYLDNLHEQAAPEVVYYGDGSIWVTERRVVSGSRSYPLNKVRSATVEEVHPRHQVWISWITGAVAFIGLVLLLRNLSEQPLDYFPVNMMSTVCAFFGGLVFLLAVLSLAFFPKRFRTPKEPLYTVVLRTRFGQATVAASLDHLYLERIVQVIRGAVDGNVNAPGARSQAGERKLSAPVIEGDDLLVDDQRYSIQKISSVDVRPYYATWLQILASTGTGIIPLFLAAGRYLKGHEWALLPVAIALAVIAFGMPLYNLAHAAEKLHTVVVEDATASYAIYASTDPAEAKQVKESIEEALQQYKQASAPYQR